MAWGIPGNVGEIYRKQQSDELRDQLLKQEMAQRIRQFDEEQKLRREEMAARAEENAANRRQDANRLGLEEMRMTRQQMTDEEERNLRESQQRAATNLQGLIPLVNRGTPQGRQEITAQLARINPVKAAEMALEPSEEEKAADRLRNLGQEREIIERTNAKYRPPQREPVPVVIMTPQGPQVLDRRTKTSEPITSGGDTVSLVPTAEQRNRQAGRQAAQPFIDAASELADRINVNQGIYAKAAGAVEKQAAKVNLDDDVAEYQAMVSAFTPMWARALGHTGVLTEQDVQSAKAILPAPGDSKSLKDRKIARINSVIDAASAAATAPAGAPAPREGGLTATPDLTGLKPGTGRRFNEGPFAGQRWTVGPDGKPQRVE